MNLANVTFLEEYKRLDKLCREIYESDRGVSSYIDDMKAVSNLGCRRVANWDNDLNMMIRLRHIRNQLTHEMGTLDLPMCSKEDIDWLMNFHHRILVSADPLALLAKCKAPKWEKAASVPVQQSAHTSNKPDTGKLSDRMIILVCLLLFIGIAIIAISTIALHNT